MNKALLKLIYQLDLGDLFAKLCNIVLEVSIVWAFCLLLFLVPLFTKGKGGLSSEMINSC